MSSLSRRGILSAGGTLLSSTFIKGISAQTPSATTQEPFSFLFITDTHLQPELDALKGCKMAFRAASQEKADFVLQGGDHIYDAMEVTLPRAHKLLDLYDMTEQELGKKFTIQSVTMTVSACTPKVVLRRKILNLVRIFSESVWRNLLRF